MNKAEKRMIEAHLGRMAEAASQLRQTSQHMTEELIRMRKEIDALRWATGTNQPGERKPGQ